MLNAPSKASDLATGAALSAAIALIWVVFTTENLVQWAPWPFREVTWLDMIRALGG
jgi:hypothetical protein